MARRRLLLQLLALAAACLLIILPSTMGASPPPPSSIPMPSTDAWAAVPHGAVDVDIPGSRRLGPRHRILSDIPVYTGAGDLAASSSAADAPAAPGSSPSDDGDADPAGGSSSSDNAAADSSVLKFLSRFILGVFYFLVVFFVLFAIVLFVAVLVKLAALAAAYVANRCATAWRSIAAAREKATRVRPVEEDAVVDGAAAGA